MKTISRSKKQSINTPEDATLEFELPLTVLNTDNQVIDLTTDEWRFRVRAQGGDLLLLNWKRLSRFINLESPVVKYTKMYLIHRLKTKKPKTVFNDFASFLRFFNWLCDQNIDLSEFSWLMFDELTARSYLEYCLLNFADKGNTLSRLREFYNWGVTNKYTQFSIENLRSIKSIRAIGNLKGHNVRFHHKTKGPFTQNELFSISQAVQDEVGSSQMRIIIMLHLELGNNPTSFALLRNLHFHKIEASGNVFFSA